MDKLNDAPSPAGASIESHNASEPTGKPENSEAGDGCCVSSCCASGFLFGEPTFASLPLGWIEVQCEYSPPRFFHVRNITLMQLSEDMKTANLYYKGGSTPVVIDCQHDRACLRQVFGEIAAYEAALRGVAREQAPVNPEGHGRISCALQLLLDGTRILLGLSQSSQPSPPECSQDSRPIVVRHVGPSI